MIARARNAFSPTNADVERVRLSVRAALAALPVPAPPAATTGAHGGGGGSGASLAGWSTSKLMVLSVTALLAAGSGYWFGRRASSRDLDVGRALTTMAPPRAVAEAPTAGSAAPLAEALASPSVSEPAPATTDVMPRGSRSSRTRKVDSRSASESLEQEVRALRSVERALRDRQPGLALALLAALDRDVPEGKLREERDAMSVIARCLQGDTPFGVNPSELFSASHADSVYLKRIEQACTERSTGGKRIHRQAETEGDQEATP